MKRIDRPSPNFDSRQGMAVDMLVLHYTDTKDLAEAFGYLLSAEKKVSAHYVVDENGDVVALVEEPQRAWHAGVSRWRGQDNINQRSIGIEMVNPGHSYGLREFPPAQMQSVIGLCKEILGRHAIPARNVVAHSDIAPARKKDPGELFDWKMLAREGIGLFPEVTSGKWQVASDEEISLSLEHYGYDVTDFPKAIAAFQRHFRPGIIDGIWDEDCQARLAALLAMI